MTAPLTIETARLLLSSPETSDAAGIFERYANDPDVTRYVGWPRHETMADTRGFLEFAAAQWAKDGVGVYLIRSKSSGQLLGSTGLSVEGPSEAMTGYVLARDAWGQGFATESLMAMVELARSIGVARLFALCHPEHRASWHVLEKGGFERDATWTRPIEFPNLERGVPRNVLCYARALTTPIRESPMP